MKLKVTYTAILALASMVMATLSISTIAASKDYTKIRKDVSMMARIISGVFQDDESCKNCRVHVETNYLAEQGAVFTIKSISRGLMIGRNQRIEIPYQTMHTLENLPEVVGDILLDVGSSLDDISSRFEVHEFEGPDLEHLEDTHVIIDRSSARELRRQARDLELQMRDQEIELLHAEKESRQALEASIKELEQTRDELESQRQGLSRKYETARKERKNERQARQAKRTKDEMDMLANVQAIIMQAFCDYGATLKNLPDDEYVSVVFERRKETRNAIFVLKKNDVIKCNSDGTTLAKKAVTYQF